MLNILSIPYVQYLSRRYWAALLILLAIHSPSLHAQEENIQISALTNHVHSRFYIIKRLEKTLQALYHLHTNHHIALPAKTISYLQSLASFENHTIKKCVHDLIRTKSLQPIFACWQTIITYKAIDDPALALEFSKLIYHLLHQLVRTPNNSHTKHLKLFISPEVEDSPITTHQVSFRFYLLKRLTKSYETLKEHRDITIRCIPTNINFIHPHTAHCYAKLQKKGSISPLEKLFAELHEYRFINDTLFVQEFLQLLFITHVSIAQTLEPENESSHSFEHITSLSITELLEAIDIQIGKHDHKQHTIPVMLEENFDFSPNYFAHYVYRRYYFVERLERIMNLFKEIDSSIQDSLPNPAHSITPTRNLSFDPIAMFDFHGSFTFKHKRIQESIRTMEHDHNLKPLFAVWDDFVTYKSIEDQLFVEEFTKEIFVISRNVLICSGICTPNWLQFRPTNSLSAQQLLDIIDTYTDQFLEHLPGYNSGRLESIIKPIRMPDLQPSVHIDDVILRYYHVQRLGTIFWLLNEIHAKSIPLQINYSTTLTGILIDSQHHFTHEHILSIIKIMQQTNSIEPLMGLMQGIQRYKYIDDAAFTREYLTLLLITLQHLQLKPKPFLTTKESLAQKTQSGYREGIDDIPLEKILEALDLIAQELPALLEKYEFNSPMAWKEWFKKYWWAPAIVLGTIGIKVLLLFRNHPLSIPPAPDQGSTPHEGNPPIPAPPAPPALTSSGKPLPARPSFGKKQNL